MTITAAFLFVLALQDPLLDRAVREVDGDLVVVLASDATDPLALLRRFASESGRTLEGEDLLVGRPAIPVDVEGRSLESVLALLGHATRTRIALTRRTITIAPEISRTESDELRFEAEAAWVSLLREFPGHEVARLARVELGRMQESLGHEDAALAHYDAAVVDPSNSKAADRALQAAGSLLMARGDWGGAMQRYSRLAQSSPDAQTQVEARLSISHALSEQGRGAEALALIDVIDLSYPAHAPTETDDRRLARARAHLAAGSAADSLRELDLRVASDPRLGARLEDLALRARVLERLDAPLEAARAWLACSTLTKANERADALYHVARLSAVGGDDLAVLFVERLSRGTPRAADIERLADSARGRLGIAAEADDLARLESRWSTRSTLTPRERAQLASKLVEALARERGADAAAVLARTAQDELPETEARLVRTALANAYETEGAWAEAARTWEGSER